MNLLFNIDYTTAFGEELILNVLANESKENPQWTAYRMATNDGTHWTYQLRLSAGNRPDTLHYFYSVETDGREKRREWTTVAHTKEFTAKKGIFYIFYDRWNDIPEDSYLYSSAFTDCINSRQLKQLKEQTFNRCVRISARAPQLRSGQRLALVGADRIFGGWNPRNAVPMVEHEHNEWVADIDLNMIRQNPMEFKFIILDERPDKAPLWETGINRTIRMPEKPNNGDVFVYELDQAFFQLYNQKVAGTLVPVFSLRSKDSFGVGDFGDLKKMIDWAAKTRQRVLQVLPINDTTTTHTWTDSYPYSCISIFALHPQYVDLNQLPEITDEMGKNRMKTLKTELNALPQIDYERVNQAKTEYLKMIFEQEGKKMMATAAYKRFFKETQSWLVPYALYCHLRDTTGTTDFSKWLGNETWNEACREPLSNSRTAAYKQVAFYYFVQFILNTQMEAVHEYAKSKGVVLKGDIPIGVNRHGCDVWMEPKYFNMNGQAGAPPDDFSVNGQNWGFPTYNWEEMLKDGCAWWVRRFQNMSKFFDAYRIDHVLGFFRIWEIPIEAVHGLLGQFSPSLGMTREEIEGYGLRFQEELFTRPFIADWTLDRIFGDRAGEVKEVFLHHLHDDIYELKPEYDTQRKIEAVFEEEIAQEKDAERIQQLKNLRDGLYALVSNVLFVRDRKNPNKFHPRISAQLDFMYEALYDSDKQVFNRIYNDYFYRRNNQFWYREAMKKLPKLVQATRMLVCAEDLGMVPDCVAWVMNELRILTLEMQTMPKDPTVRFGHLSRNPYRSVCTISSHDTPTLRQWWDEDTERTQDYYNTMLYRGGAAPHPLPGWLAADIISRHLTSPSMLCIISIQDWMAIDEDLRLADANAERINIPANPKHYWRYRMHVNIEDLMQNDDFCNEVKELIKQAGRN